MIWGYHYFRKHPFGKDPTTLFLEDLQSPWLLTSYRDDPPSIWGFICLVPFLGFESKIMTEIRAGLYKNTLYTVYHFGEKLRFLLEA